MIKTAIKTIPAQKKTVNVAIVCDACGKKSKDDDSWSEGRFDVNEIIITHETGHNYPDGGSGEKFTVDLCPDCFENKFKPWLDSQNIKGRTEEWDW